MNAHDISQQLSDLEWITEPTRVHKLSQDFSWYSPVLKRQLADKTAQAVVRPKTEQEIKEVVSLCATHGVPLTLRGTGTGNYGQCIPLNGGIVMDMSAYNQVLWIREGVARSQTGIRLTEFDKIAKTHGFELRWIPSTFRSATLGGLYGGGFGGAGSINYGPIAAPGNILKVRVMSMDKEPVVHELSDAQALLTHHTYGTNGIVLEIEFSLAPLVEWSEAMVVFNEFDDALNFANDFATGAGYQKKEVAFMADPIPGYFTTFASSLPKGTHAVILVLAPSSCDPMKALALKHQGEVSYLKSAQEVQSSNRTLIELTWNHTTLQALKVDKTLTYIQSGFDPSKYMEQVRALEKELKGEVMMHLEFIRTKEGLINCSGLQIIRFTTEERLNEIMQIHRDHGVQINNPHVYTLEDGKAGNKLNPEVLKLKDQLDPQGLLNPGKLRTWSRPLQQFNA